jgi:diguanylate cyclase (GGDEF)-like protein/PAS domain S-box-containing protein
VAPLTLPATRACLDATDVGVGVVRSRGRLRHVNASLRALLEDVPELAEVLGGNAPEEDLRLVDRQGRLRYLSVSRTPAGRRTTVVVHDETVLRTTQALLAQSEARFRRTFDSSPVGMLLVNAESDLLLASNPAFAAFVGGTAAELVGIPLGRLLARPDDVEAVRRRAGEFQFARLDGSLRWGAVAPALIEQHASGDLLLLQVDDVEERVTASRRLAHQASLDPLTGLANHRELSRHLSHRLAEVGLESRCRSIGVLLLDLDGFRAVNDRYGHDAGDAVLLATAERLLGLVRPGDQVARVGGDEFVVVVSPTDQAALVDLARRVRTALSLPVRWNGTRLELSASIGLNLGTADNDSDSLMHGAGRAMRRAQSQGGARFELYDAALRQEDEDRRRIEQALRDALHQGGVSVVYQPVVAQNGCVVGVEALARLTTPEGLEIGAGAFVPVAEECDLMPPLGLQVLDTAIAQAAHWHASGRGLRTSVNVSARQLSRGDLATEVLSALDRHGLPPDLLELEITETAFISAGPSTLQQLQHLREHDVHLAIDDYGTGHASLAYLHRLPATTLKVDASFVAGLPDDRRATAIVRAVTALARDLGITCVAEGVERHEQREWLFTHAPEALLQGYLTGRPGPASELSDRIVLPVRPIDDDLMRRPS